MRAMLWISFAFVGVISVAVGCHQLAGVRTDGVLETAGEGGSGGGAAGAGGKGGAAGAGGMGGQAGGGGTGGNGNCNPDECLSKTCENDKCKPVNAICSAEGAPFLVFIPPEFAKPDSRLLVAHNSKGVYVAVGDEIGPQAKFRAKFIDAATQSLSLGVDCVLPSAEATMVRTRATETEYVLQGYQYQTNSTMTEVSFPLDPVDGDLMGTCTPMPMPSWPECADRMESAEFARMGNVTKYAATCHDAMDPNLWHLVTGGSDEQNYKVVASALSTDYSIRVAGLSFIKNERVIWAGPELYGQIGYRRESDGYMPHAIDLSMDPNRQEALLGAITEVEGESAYLLMGSGLLPPQFQADLLAGVVSDLNQFTTVPPTGLKTLASLSGADVAKLGTYSQPSRDDVSYSVGISPLSKKSADIYWFSRTGETLVGGQSVYTVPAGDNTLIPRVSFVPLGSLFRLALWREDLNGQVTVRAQRFVCSY